MASKQRLPDLSIGFFDNPVALLHLAQERADTLRMALGYCDAQVWVALFDFAMAVNALSDWVRSAQPALEDATMELARLPVMGAWRDIANAGKHVKLDRAYSVAAIKRADRREPGTLNAAGLPEQRLWRLRVELLDGSEPYLEDLVEDVLKSWEAFFKRHAIT